MKCVWINPFTFKHEAFVASDLVEAVALCRKFAHQLEPPVRPCQEEVPLWVEKKHWTSVRVVWG